MYIGFHDGLRTVVVAADNMDEFERFAELVEDAEDRLCEQFSQKSFSDMLADDAFRGFVVEPYVAVHETARQQAEFAVAFGIQITGRVRALSHQQVMLEGGSADALDPGEDEPDGNLTIAQQLGIAEVDPWDQRTDEEKERDEKRRKAFEKSKRAGQMADGSFGENTGGPIVTDIEATTMPSGRVRVDGVLAVKDHSDPDAPQVGEGVEAVDTTVRRVIDAPRPWNARRDELDQMTDEERAKVLARVSAKEFIFSGYSLPLGQGSVIYIAPAEFFAAEQRMWDAPLPLDTLLPRGMRQTSPGRYETRSDWTSVQHDLCNRGFIEDLFEFGSYINTVSFQ